MLTLMEKEDIKAKVIPIANRVFSDSEILKDPNLEKLVYKVLLRYLEVNDRHDLPVDKVEFNELFYKVWEHICVTAVNETALMSGIIREDEEFTTGELATFFGVSVTTINNWINQGRFEGVIKGAKNKQVRIAGDTFWRSGAGKRMTVQEVVTRYREEQQRTQRDQERTEMGEIQELEDMIHFYEKKYGGPYEETLAIAMTKSGEEQRDAHEWEYLLRRVKNVQSRADKLRRLSR